MIILKPDHVITGEEYVRSIVCYQEGYRDDDEPVLYWTPISHRLGSCWKGKTIREFEETPPHFGHYVYEYAMIDPIEYCPNKRKLNDKRSELLGW